MVVSVGGRSVLVRVVVLGVGPATAPRAEPRDEQARPQRERDQAGRQAEPRVDAFGREDLGHRQHDEPEREHRRRMHHGDRAPDGDRVSSPSAGAHQVGGHQCLPVAGAEGVERTEPERQEQRHQHERAGPADQTGERAARHVGPGPLAGRRRSMPRRARRSPDGTTGWPRGRRAGWRADPAGRTGARSRRCGRGRSNRRRPSRRRPPPSPRPNRSGRRSSHRRTPARRWTRRGPRTSPRAAGCRARPDPDGTASTTRRRRAGRAGRPPSWSGSRGAWAPCERPRRRVRHR